MFMLITAIVCIPKQITVTCAVDLRNQFSLIECYISHFPREIRKVITQICSHNGKISLFTDYALNVYALNVYAKVVNSTIFSDTSEGI